MAGGPGARSLSAGAGAPPRVRIAVGDLAEGQTRLFDFEREGAALTGIVIRHAEGLAVYVNRCPHVTYSLDYGDGQVLDDSGRFLMCSSHGAMFLPESGECSKGPAHGKRLEALRFTRGGDALLVTFPPEPDDWR